MESRAMLSKITVSDFFNLEYVNQASYDNLRKIASLVDGQKNASRKVLYTILEQNIKTKLKVSQLASRVSEFAEYLHGDISSVIVNLAQDFTGSNNIALLQKSGNFGTRFSPEASAARYIFACGSEQFFKIFKKEDDPILKHQYFEGSKIEPMFYVPSIPILLVNGSEGVSSGFAQKILPRNPKDITRYITEYLKNGKSNVKLIPYYNGFKGKIEQGETPQQWLIKGVIEKIGVNKVLIKEVPIGYDLKGYLSVLDDLEEKKVIQSYKDKSENDNFLFEVTIPSKTLANLTEDEILERLKLIKKVTENFTVIDENNKIVVYDNVTDVLNHYIRVKLEYLGKRKDYILEKLKEEIKYAYSKYYFIKLIVENKLKIVKRKKADIEKDLAQYEKIIKKDGSYDYLLNMNLMSLTLERMEKLEQDIKQMKKQIDELQAKTLADIWNDDLKSLGL